jgi:hypothetical protein
LDPPCYLHPPGPDYAEAANVDTAGFFAIQNLLDGTCIGIGPPDNGPPYCGCHCEINPWELTQLRTSPCGMRYQVGPRTVQLFFEYAPENSSIIAYHGPDDGALYGTGLTAEISFYIAQTPTQWTKLIELEGYPRFNNALNGGPGSLGDNNYCQIQLRHFVSGFPDNEWHLVANADNTFSLGTVDSMLNQWVTVRIALGSFAGLGGKPQMVVWKDGILNHSAGWDAVNEGDDNGDTVSGSQHGYCRFGYNHGDSGDVRIGTMAFTNSGVFTPNPRGQCRNIAEGWRYVRYLPSPPKTRVNPEICDNSIDDDGDSLVDCDDPDCFQDDACNNLLVNGSFELPISPCEEVTCPGGLNTKPGGWDRMPANTGDPVTVGDQWLPVPAFTDGHSRGSISSSGTAEEIVYQTVLVVPGTPLILKGDIATGHGALASYTHFVEILDGDENSATVLDRFEVTTSGGGFQPFSLTGASSTGEVTVRWGYTKSGFGTGPVTTHVDNLYLSGTGRGQCNDPFADADGDGDVDHDDFGVAQACVTGAGMGPVSSTCTCFDVDGAGGFPDDDVDQADVNLFESCASGPGVPADIACDDAIVQPPANLVSAASRRAHGGAGNFDVDLLALGGAIEPRNGGPRKIVITYDAPLQAADGSFELGDEVTVSSGANIVATLDCDSVIIDLDSVPDESCLTVHLTGLALASDIAAVLPDKQFAVVALAGDVNGNGTVSQADEDIVTANLGLGLSPATFRSDVDADGDVDNVDVILTGAWDGNAGSCP